MNMYMYTIAKSLIHFYLHVQVCLVVTGHVLHWIEEPLYCRHHSDRSKCLQYTKAILGTLESVLFIEVSTFQSVLIKEVPLYKSIIYEWPHKQMHWPMICYMYSVWYSSYSKDCLKLHVNNKYEKKITVHTLKVHNYRGIQSRDNGN